MNYLLRAVLAASVAIPASADTDGRHALYLSPSTPEVVVAPRPVGRIPLRLPELEYELRLTASCAQSFSARALSLAIADSLRTIDGADLAAATAGIRMTVPAQQLAPLIVSDFCVTPAAGGDAAPAADGRPAAPSLTLQGVVSAHASLVCGNDAAEEITYAAVPLDVTLVCADLATAE